MTFSRGSSESRVACRATENAPEITAWEAITVATAASATSGMRSTSGTRVKKGFAIVAGSARMSAPWPR